MPIRIGPKPSTQSLESGPRRPVAAVVVGWEPFPFDIGVTALVGGKVTAVVVALVGAVVVPAEPVSFFSSFAQPAAPRRATVTTRGISRARVVLMPITMRAQGHGPFSIV
jgi:hypothetical protein